MAALPLYTYKGRDLSDLPQTGFLRLFIDRYYLKHQVTRVDDIKALPFNRTKQITVLELEEEEPVEEICRQVVSSNVLESFAAIKIPVSLKPIDLMKAPISRCLTTLSLSNVLVDHVFRRALSKVIAFSCSLKTLECSEAYESQPWTHCVLPTLNALRGKALSCHVYEPFRFIDYFLLARHHITFRAFIDDKVEKDIPVDFFYGEPLERTGFTNERRCFRAAMKFMFAAGEKACDTVTYTYSDATGLDTTGKSNPEALFTQVNSCEF